MIHFVSYYLYSDTGCLLGNTRMATDKLELRVTGCGLRVAHSFFELLERLELSTLNFELF